MKPINRFKIFLATVGLSGLVACGVFDNESPVIHATKDYQSRIYNLLGGQTVETTSPPRFRFPERDKLAIQLAPVTVKWSDFFSTFKCPDLQQLISERNSQLGRSADALNKLLYELKFHSSYANCGINFSQLSDDWQQGMRQKRDQYASVVFNNTWASSYWQKIFFSSAANEHSDDSIHSVLNSLAIIRTEISTLNEVITTVSQDSEHEATLSTDKLLSSFRVLEINSGALGTLLQDGLQTEHLLLQINANLTSEINKVCPQKIPTQKAEYLVNVLRKYFLGDVQHKIRIMINNLRNLEAEAIKWREVIETSWPEHLNSALLLDNNDLLSERLTNSVRNHIKLWQKLQESCGLTIHKNRT